MPEKLSLFFSSSWGDGGLGEAEVGSIFYVDGVEFIYNPNSVNEVYNAKGWNVYPNPVNEILTINGNVGEGSVVQLFDITGKEVITESLQSNTGFIEVSRLQNGIYIYQISSISGELLRTGKVMVTH